MTYSPLSLGISLLFGVYFIYLGKIAPRTTGDKKLTAAFILYVIVALGIALAHYSYRLQLMDSAGG